MRWLRRRCASRHEIEWHYERPAHQVRCQRRRGHVGTHSAPYGFNAVIWT